MMDLLDAFAAAALRGLLAADADAVLDPKGAAELAYNYAVAMLKERESRYGWRRKPEDKEP
jgi:hypothetical protein